jgi:predicted dehydrogenase
MAQACIAVIGAGYWGPNLIRNLHDNGAAKLKYVCDLSDSNLAKIGKTYPTIKLTKDHNEILSDKEVSGVVIATPAETHYKLAKDCLLAGKHVMVEKPLTYDLKQAEELVRISESTGRHLMVGHTYEYNMAIQWIKRYIEDGELGVIYYAYSKRVNLGQIRRDVNALWNFAPHDVSTLVYLMGKEPKAVSAKGRSFIQDGVEDVVFMDLEFEGGTFCNVHVSWLDPNKERKIVIVGSKKMVIFDDMSAEMKVMIYDKGFDVKNGQTANFGEFQLITRAGNIFIPKISYTEPLKLECAHFIECILTGNKPQTDGRNGLRVTRVLSAAAESMKSGKPVSFSPTAK